MLGIDSDYDVFDIDIIVHINSVFMTLNQLGVGPKIPFVISDKNATWTDFSKDMDVEALKSYMWIQVKLLFDPPDKSFVIDSYQQMLKNYEYRMMIQKEAE